MSHLFPRLCAAPQLFVFLFLLTLFAPCCVAHMVMSEPPPINYKTNPYYNTAKADFDYTSPLTPSGSNFPCKGHLADYNAPEGQSVRNYAPGGTYPLKIDGQAVHGGGSCQASLSFDGGVSWTVIKSWIGDCPHASGQDQNFQFTIPSSTPSGKAIFAWTWFNQIGNREMYMNCAVVTITGGKKKRAKRALAGPSVFVANVGNGCSTTAGTDVVFPDAGQDIQYGGDASRRASPAGTCSGKQYTGGGVTAAGGGTGSTGSSGGENPNNGAGSGGSGSTSSSSSSGGGSGAGGTGTGTGGAGAGGADTGTGGGAGAGGAAGSGLNTQTAVAGVGTGFFAASPPPGATGPQPTSSFSPGSGSGSGGGVGGTGTTTVSDGTEGQGCTYWKSQGYICSEASTLRAGWVWGVGVFAAAVAVAWLW